MYIRIIVMNRIRLSVIMMNIQDYNNNNTKDSYGDSTDTTIETVSADSDADRKTLLQKYRIITVWMVIRNTGLTRGRKQ